MKLKKLKNPSSKIRKMDIVLIFIATIIVLFEVAPFLWTLLMSFKSRLDIFEIPPKLFFTPTLSNYYAAFVEGSFSKYLINSLIIDFSSTILVVIIGVCAAYAFSRFKIFGAKHIFFFILTTRMCPAVVTVLPIFMIFSKFKLYDTHIGIILVHIVFNLGLTVWLMRGFFDDIPKEIDQAAMVDGHSKWTIFTRFMLPLVLPGIVVCAVFCLIFSWNEFLFSLILTQFNAVTLPAGLPQLMTSRGTYWGQVASVGVVITMPVLILTLVFHKYLIRGLTFGAIKT
jgi:multiple sugar transport system permease protein